MISACPHPGGLRDAFGQAFSLEILPSTARIVSAGTTGTVPARLPSDAQAQTAAARRARGWHAPARGGFKAGRRHTEAASVAPPSSTLSWA